MFCSKCGLENPDESRFCSKCGTPISAEERMLAQMKLNLQPNVAGVLCYALWWITGFVILYMEKNNKFVRFHAIQSIVVFVPIHLIMLLLNTFFLPIGGLFSIAAFVLWVLLMLKAYNSEMFKLPIAGDIAEKHIT